MTQVFIKDLDSTLNKPIFSQMILVQVIFKDILGDKKCLLKAFLKYFYNSLSKNFHVTIEEEKISSVLQISVLQSCNNS